MVAAPFEGLPLEGYEIHMGRTERLGGTAFARFPDGREDGAALGNVYGTYLHGLFDTGALTTRLASYLAGRRGISVPELFVEPRAAYRQRQYDLLADAVRQSLNLSAIYDAMEAFEHGGASSAQ